MILDKGIATVFRRTETAEPGEMPKPCYKALARSWYGELSFETSPARQTEGRKELRTDLRVRILRCTAIKQDDVVVLRYLDRFDDRQPGDLIYKINRAYHGRDDDNGEQITDLSLEVDRP